MYSLHGKRALVIGIRNKYSIATQTALSFLSLGADVIGVSKEPLSFTAMEACGLHKQALKFKLLSCDLTDEFALEELLRSCGQHFHGGIDTIVHSVAFASPEAFIPIQKDSQTPSGGLLQTSKAHWQQAQDISAYSLVALTQKALPLLTKGSINADKSIIAFSFEGANKVVPSYNVMGPAKAALEAVSRQLAVELGGHNIRVNCVSPGPINTASARGIPGFSTMRQFAQEQAPLKRNATALDIANLASFLASEAASCITGQTIKVDGGMSALSSYNL
uniref:Enoyl putative n=1 Tax=Albugo laibachii Nc14 TaxID=890382 RepID=F0VYN5_9STRA|nr:enoyl putative [Albugo laibachii Nc14]|eukprot:CCA13899.1 enoyl putative [Albugo laibachii Nc14]